MGAVVVLVQNGVCEVQLSDPSFERDKVMFDLFLTVVWTMLNLFEIALNSDKYPYNSASPERGHQTPKLSKTIKNYQITINNYRDSYLIVM